MDKTNTEALIAYIPVIQRGYLDMFSRHPAADMLILDNDVLGDFDYLRKDIRALSPDEAYWLIEAVAIFPTVRLLGKAALSTVAEKYPKITMPHDDISHVLMERYFAQNEVKFEPAFLRWDRSNAPVNVDIEPDRVVKASEREDKVISLLFAEASKSSNIWRRVGAAIVYGDEALFSAHNTHLPTEYSPWIDGDVRATLKRGVGVELSTDEHAEAIMIGTAAKKGIPLEGTSIFVDTFPCPPCAKLIARTGIKSIYYVSGYAMVDGVSVLKDAGVEIVRIDTDQARTVGPEAVPYPER